MLCFPGVTISFIIAGVSCVLNALCYAELASRFPAVVGGAYLYTYSAFNEITAFLVFTQLMLDYHIGAASIARSLASYVVTVLELIPFLKDNIPSWVGHGFDAVANSAERIQETPGIVKPHGLCCIVHWSLLSDYWNGSIPIPWRRSTFAEAFTSKGLKYVSVLISFGAVAGLTTTLLVGLYVQPAPWHAFLTSMCSHIFYQLDPWVNGLFQTGYSVVSACVVRLRWKDETSSQASTKLISSRAEGIIYLLAIACCGFTAGVLFRFGASFIFLIVAAVIGILSAAALYVRQVHTSPPGFSCPGVPVVPSISIFLNMFLFAQLHYEAWVRFVVLSIVALVIYASYGQFHADPGAADADNFLIAKESRQIPDHVLGSWKNYRCESFWIY
ncbi:UNVERIFIED_CONTAM: Cationic amino acid transporter 9, chloroplastic [Sesamum radiatum]|uniref:Cationic amino acid transporter 9, chloroplastic n=1 Tax=Sesamum radiatum TaxID=300843 RepID=A0AAW2V9V8_SESRA